MDIAPTASSTPNTPTAADTSQARRVSDPFALHRDAHTDIEAIAPENDLFAERSASTNLEYTDPVPIAKRDRRLSKEWDAAKTPPSRFQKVEGSIYATPASRDGKVDRNKIHGFKEKVKGLGNGFVGYGHGRKKSVIEAEIVTSTSASNELK